MEREIFSAVSFTSCDQLAFMRSAGAVDKISKDVNRALADPGRRIIPRLPGVPPVRCKQEPGGESLSG